MSLRIRLEIRSTGRRRIANDAPVGPSYSSFSQRGKNSVGTAVTALFFCASALFVAAQDGDRIPPPPQGSVTAAAPENDQPKIRTTIVPKGGNEESDEAKISDRQFSAQADRLEDRATLLNFAESVSDDFSKLLGKKEGWQVPIRLNLFGGLGVDSGQQDSRTEVEYFDDARAFTIVLHLKLPQGFSNRWLEREVVRVLLLEQMLQNPAVANASEAKLTVPYWLQIGLLEAIEHRSKGRPSDLYSRLLRARQVLPIDQLLTMREKDVGKDSLSQSVFRGSAGALVEALMSQQEGAESLLQWLGDFPLFQGDPSALFRQHFPGLRTGDSSLAKWWSLQVASMGQQQALEYSTVEETEKAIDAALQVKLPNPATLAQEENEPGMVKKMLGWFSGGDENQTFHTGRLHDFEKFVDQPGATETLEKNLAALEGVKARGFPLYRPAVESYIAATERLIEGDQRGVGKLLEEGDTTRENIGQVMIRTRDFLNYYQATQVGERSGDFEGYSKALDQLRSQKPEPRGDRISSYLDELEREFR